MDRVNPQEKISKNLKFNVLNFVDRTVIETVFSACKADVIATILTALDKAFLFNRKDLIRKPIQLCDPGGD